MFGGFISILQSYITCPVNMDKLLFSLSQPHNRLVTLPLTQCMLNRLTGFKLVGKSVTSEKRAGGSVSLGDFYFYLCPPPPWLITFLLGLLVFSVCFFFFACKSGCWQERNCRNVEAVAFLQSAIVLNFLCVLFKLRQQHD